MTCINCNSVSNCLTCKDYNSNYCLTCATGNTINVANNTCEETCSTGSYLTSKILLFIIKLTNKFNFNDYKF